MTATGRRPGLISYIPSAVLVFISILLITVAIIADRLGISNPGFGLGQLILIVVGVLILLIAFALLSKTVRQRARRLVLSRASLILVGFIVGVICVEVGLRVLEYIEFPDTRDEAGSLAQPVPDSRLGLRLAPYAGGHDANGFRNDSVPDRVDIVAIGDSQTWGINARRSEAWPQTLSTLSGNSTYNMGLGYYGPVQYWVLIEDAIKLSPDVIVIGLYFGNDIWGAYDAVYPGGLYPELRDSGTDDDLLNDTISPEAQTLSRESKEFRAGFKPASILNRGEFSSLLKLSAIGRLMDRLGWLPYNTNSYGFQRDKAWAQTFPSHGAIYEQGNIQTVFTPSYRLLAIDLDEPRINEGLRITEEVVLRINAETEAADIALLILLIPTKEAVYADAVETAHGSLDETYARLVQMEERARTKIIALCDENGIEYVDALPALTGAIQRNERIYPATTDGHPDVRGYYILASEVYQMLK